MTASDFLRSIDWPFFWLVFTALALTGIASRFSVCVKQLSTRFAPPALVFCGIVLAVVAQSYVAVWLGSRLGRSVSWLPRLAAPTILVLFAIFQALRANLPGRFRNEEWHAPPPAPVLSFSIAFVASMSTIAGSVTQITVAAVAASRVQLPTVFLAACLSHTTIANYMLLFGARRARALPLPTLCRASALLLMALAVWCRRFAP